MGEDLTISKFKNICRTCMKENSLLKPLFNTGTEVNFVDMLKSFTFIQFNQNDGLPNKICDKCIEHLFITFNFINTCMKADGDLRKCLINYHNSMMPKTECVDIVKVEKPTATILETIDLTIQQQNPVTVNNNNKKKKKTFRASSEKIQENVINGSLNDKTKQGTEILAILESESTTTKISSSSSASTPASSTTSTSSSTTTTTSSSSLVPTPTISDNLNNNYNNTTEDLSNNSSDFMLRLSDSNNSDNEINFLNNVGLIPETSKTNNNTAKTKTAALSTKKMKKTESKQPKPIHEVLIKVKNTFELIDNNDDVEDNEVFLGFEMEKEVKNCNLCKIEPTPVQVENCKRCYVLVQPLLNGNNQAVTNNKIKIKNGRYTCNICRRKFFDHSIFLQHEQLHTGQLRPYECATCKKRYITKHHLIRHLKTHTKNNNYYNCEVCNKHFIELHDLTSHERVHTGKRTYKCTICSKTFLFKGNLMQHKKKHTGDLPFHCDYCGKKFFALCHLDVHKRIHTGERPYYCTICARAFAQKSNLKRHLLTNHFITN